MVEKSMNNSVEKTDLFKISVNKKSKIAIFSVFLTLLMFVVTGCNGGGGNVADNAPQLPATPDVEVDASKDPATADSTEVVDDVLVEAGESGLGAVAKSGNKTNNKDNKKVDKNKSEDDEIDVLSGKSDKMVTMVVEDTGRANPFLPVNETAKTSDDQEQQLLNLQKAKLQYDLIDPPNSAQIDGEAEKILTTTVSGIMYDKTSPSAILNIEGSDFLVRSGDVINGYKVLAISPSVVTVQLGANIYKAGVGHLLATDGINYNTVSNLNNKFGGAKK